MTTPADSEFPTARPAGLEVVSFGATWWRIDLDHPDDWSWDPPPCAQERFDPRTCRFRVRYAASSRVAAARECFPDRCLQAEHGDQWLVRLEGTVDMLDLTDVATLDALGLDDRISTGRLDDTDGGDDPLLIRAQALADAVWDWWDGEPPALLYRNQSTPTARSLAFHADVTWSRVTACRLRSARGLLQELTAQHRFVVPVSFDSAATT